MINTAKKATRSRYAHAHARETRLKWNEVQLPIEEPASRHYAHSEGATHLTFNSKKVRPNFVSSVNRTYQLKSYG